MDQLTPVSWPRDYHAVHTITLGELVDYGFVDWEDPTWAWDFYDEEQRDRLQRLFEGRYRWREISIVPPGRWKAQLIQKLNEIMPKYKPLYKLVAEGIDPLQVSNEYGKSRDIFSEFPQTMLSGRSDYASTGNDRQYERITEGDVVEKFAAIRDRLQSVDAMVLDELETLFSCLFTANMNSY